MLDRDGYRPNVGIILANLRNEVFWGKRVNQHSWQFPQGGIQHGETPEKAMYRELEEEIGLKTDHVRILGRTRQWLRRQAARQRPSGIRCLALARLLGAGGIGDRIQARGLQPGAGRAAPLPQRRPAPARAARGGCADAGRGIGIAVFNSQYCENQFAQLGARR